MSKPETIHYPNLFEIQDMISKYPIPKGSNTYTLANKYVDYWCKARQQNGYGRKGYRDSSQQKVYDAENAAIREVKNIKCKVTRAKLEALTSNGYMEWKDVERFFKKVSKSATYQKLCKKNKESKYISQKANVSFSPILKKFQGHRFGGMAYGNGVMKINPISGMCKPTILHEFAHLCGNMNHDWSFRADYLKLCSMFIGKEFAKLTKKEYMKRKLKTTFSEKKVKTVEQWVISYQKMAMLRKAKRV